MERPNTGTKSTDIQSNINNDTNTTANNDENTKAHPLHRIKGPATKEHVAGYSPQQIKRGYDFDEYYTGRGQLIAIVSAFDYPTLKQDLEVFNRQFHLPPAKLAVIYAKGVVPPVDADWAMETALDVQWAHALAPEAAIVVVLAASNTFIDLFQAVDVANSTGANVVSMSWGGAEFSGETVFDSHLKRPGTVYVAGSGDIGGQTIYPSVSQYVLSAGGTQLWLDSCGNQVRPERVWMEGGGGPSVFIPIPPWQKEFRSAAELTRAYRGTPDVAFDADLVTGVAIYDSTPLGGLSGWLLGGGTSLSAPAWAAIIALMGEGRSRFSNISEVLYEIAGQTDYDLPQFFFNDIVEGTAGPYSATVGWDFCTGLGSPVVHCLTQHTHRPCRRFDD